MYKLYTNNRNIEGDGCVSEKIDIRMDLEGEIAKRFKAVKRWLGLKQNTEVIRALITDRYMKIREFEEAAEG